MDLDAFPFYERGRRPLKTCPPAIKFVPVIPALAQCLLSLLLRKMARCIAHSLALTATLALRSAATVATAADLFIVRRIAALALDLRFVSFLLRLDHGISGVDAPERCGEILNEITTDAVIGFT